MRTQRHLRSKGLLPSRIGGLTLGWGDLGQARTSHKVINPIRIETTGGQAPVVGGAQAGWNCEPKPIERIALLGQPGLPGGGAGFLGADMKQQPRPLHGVQATVLPVGCDGAGWNMNME